MKRVISIFMLFVATLIAFHPTFAMHYCGGSLSTLKLFGDVTETCCCGEKAEQCADEHLSPNDFQFAAADNPCCSNQVVEMKTDDFQTAQSTPTIIKNQLIVPFVFLQTQLLRLSELYESTSIQICYPPGGIIKYGSDLLSLICIYRI